jgi:hypothetical protein
VNAAEQLIEQGRAQGRADGLEQGEVKGLRAAITHVLAARSLALSELGRARFRARSRRRPRSTLPPAGMARRSCRRP